MFLFLWISLSSEGLRNVNLRFYQVLINFVRTKGLIKYMVLNEVLINPMDILLKIRAKDYKSFKKFLRCD